MGYIVGNCYLCIVPFFVFWLDTLEDCMDLSVVSDYFILTFLLCGS
jgi:hypothetical protein